MLDRGELTRPQARELFREMISTGRRPSQLTRGRSRAAVDGDSIARVVSKLLSEDDAAADAKNNPKAFNYLIGQVLRLEPGADPKVVAKTLARMLKQE
jgi:Asp-tRNA(Asn)/Glu-tRNA(Gln) amidotransferase B subunit